MNKGLPVILLKR